MRFRGCMLSLAVLAGLVLICCSLAWFLGVPRLRDQVADNIADALSTEVAEQLTISAGPLEPGDHTIDLNEITRQIEQTAGATGTDDFFITASQQEGISIGFTSGAQEFKYSGMPVARDGRLVVENMDVTEDFLGWIMPADRVGQVIEDGINGYFEGQGMQIDGLVIGNDTITFTVSPARE